jgi:hypothetical protein
MDKTNKKEDTLIKLKELLTICNIKKIYYVDDENNLPVVNKEIIKGLLYKIFSSEKENEVYQSGIRMFEEDQPVEVLIQCVDKYWETTSKDVQDKILLTLSSISNSEKINLARPHSLKHQIPEEYLMFWSPYEWDTNKENLEKDLNGNEKVLVLFDEDLKYAKNYELTRGQDLIAAVKKSGNKNFICTLLTHKIPAPKDELGFRIDVLKKNEDLTEEDFFPLAKSRIDDPAVFADGLKKALLNKHIVKIKKQSIAIIEAGYREAITKINNFDIYDFEDLILLLKMN